MKILSLALRNILRNKRRSLTTLLAMIMGVLTILLFGGYSRDISYGLETGYVQRSGHLQLQRKDYFLYGSGNPSAYGIPEYRKIMKTINEDPVLADMVIVTTPILQFGGVAGNFSEGVSRTVFATGIEVEEQNRLRSWNDYKTFQSLQNSALTATNEDSVIIGTGVARSLQLCEQLKVPNCVQTAIKKVSVSDSLPGDIASLSNSEKRAPNLDMERRIEILAANTHGAPNVTGLKVIKAEVQGVKELDDVYVAMHLSKAQKLLYGSGDQKVTAIVVQLRHTNQIAAARTRLEEIFIKHAPSGIEPLEIHDFAALNPFYKQAVAMFNTIFGFMAVLIGSIVLFTVGNTMGMAVMERTVEIGTLRALGLKRKGIRWLFVSEGLLLGLIGASLGVLFAIGIATLINYSGITWTPPGWAKSIPLVVRVWGETKLVASAAAGIMIVAVISAWWPARRAARMNVVDALRHV